MRIGYVLVLIGHLFRAQCRFLQVRMILPQEGQLSLEEIVHIFHRGPQIDLVRRFAQVFHQPTEDVDLFLHFRAQILIVHEKHLQMGVLPKDGMGGETRQKHLMHGDRLFEGGQILGLQLLFHLFELFLGHVPFAFPQSLQFFTRRIKVGSRWARWYDEAGVLIVLFKPLVQPNEFFVLAYDEKIALIESGQIRACMDGKLDPLLFAQCIRNVHQ
uniref:Putative secreted peptide n=1 Tax=Anopheles braziliensis TaxID=58242 RepID=A0A2M3ZNN6_9DIPT